MDSDQVGNMIFPDKRFCFLGCLLLHLYVCCCYLSFFFFFKHLKVCYHCSLQSIQLCVSDKGSKSWLFCLTCEYHLRRFRNGNYSDFILFCKGRRVKAVKMRKGVKQEGVFIHSVLITTSAVLKLLKNRAQNVTGKCCINRKKQNNYLICILL